MVHIQDCKQTDKSAVRIVKIHFFPFLSSTYMQYTLCIVVIVIWCYIAISNVSAFNTLFDLLQHPSPGLQAHKPHCGVPVQPDAANAAANAAPVANWEASCASQLPRPKLKLGMGSKPAKIEARMVTRWDDGKMITPSVEDYGKMGRLWWKHWPDDMIIAKRWYSILVPFFDDAKFEWASSSWYTYIYICIILYIFILRIYLYIDYEICLRCDGRVDGGFMFLLVDQPELASICVF